MFLAIVSASKGSGRARLTDVIGAADGINHAIPLEQELRGGINRLIHAELVSADEAGLGPTEIGEALAQEVGRPSHSVSMQQLELRLARLTDPEAPAWLPTHAEIRAAIEAYQSRAREWLRRNP